MKKFTDADNLAFLQQQAAIVNKEAVELDYQSQYSQLIPVSTAGNPFAPAVVFVSEAKVGRANWINGNADDLPMADLDMKEAVQTVHTAAIGYGYGWQELNSAQAMGINLTADKAIAARRAYEEFVDVLSFNGDSSKSITGLTNLGANDRQRVFDNTSNNWADAAKLTQLIYKNLLETGKNNSPTADTVLLPPTLFALLASSFLSNGSTYLAQIQTGNPVTGITGKPLTIRAVSGLATAGTGGAERIIMYRKDPSVLQLHIPMPHRFLPVHQSGPLRWEVPGVFRLAGINVKRPDDVLYLDHASS